MAKVTVTLATAPQSFPAGTVAGLLKVTLSASTPGLNGDSIFIEQEQGPFVFEDVAVGNYMIRAERVSATGEPLGTPVVKQFSVVSTSTEIHVPVDFTVVQE